MGFRLLPIARPCNASFAAMPGDEKKRFCDSCDKHVHDISAGTEEEARALFAANPSGRVCVRFAKDGAGNVRFRGAAVAVAISLAACGSPMTTATPAQDPSSIDHEMGDGIPDDQDECPDPATKSSVDDDDGCPEPATVPQATDAGK